MLTDLEAAAIGNILKHQPCTAHFIRTCFRLSPTSRFCDSAGSVYPMMKRLEKRGLVESEEKREGLRRVRYYRCTKDGKAEMRKWIGPPVSSDAALTIDPLRTRFTFLCHLQKSQRRRWFANVEKATRERIEAIERQLAEFDSNEPNLIYLQLAGKQAVMDLNTKLQWLALARQKLAEDGQLSD